MCEKALLPSPNWFLTSIASCSATGILAYGSRNGIVLVLSLEEKDGTAPEPKFTMISNAHHEKITTLAFCNRILPTGHTLPNYALASGSEDGVVSIWNVETSENIMHQREHRERVTCIDWTRAGDFLLISADEKGKFVVWDVLANSARSQQLLNASRLSPITIACSPTNQDLVAVGCKDGHVCLLNIKGSGQLLTKLRGHDKAVVSLSWSPQEGEPASTFLASGGLDRTIHIWKTSSGQCLKVIHLPAKQLSKGFKARADNSKGNIQPWLPVCWLKPTLLLSASSSSELLAWNPLEDKPTASLVHSEHLRGLACIAAHPYKGDQKNWRAPEKPCTVWTMAQDRMLIRTEFLGTTTPATANAEQENVEQAVEAEKQFPDEESLPVELIAKPESNGLADEVAKEAKELVNGTIPKQTVPDEPPALGCEAALEVGVVEKFETAKEAEETTEPDMKLKEEEEESTQAPAESVAVEQFEKAKEADEIQDDKTTNSELEETASEISDTTSGKEESTTEKDEIVNDVKNLPKKKAVVKKAKELLTRSTILPTLGGFVYFLAPCPFTPGRVAIAVGDETIRVWNMNDRNSSNVVCIWQRIKGKVMSLSWHPEKEGVLGFSTSEGRVGICNVSNLGKEPVVFRQFHRSTVYRVAWGPPTYAKTDEPPAKSDFCLYASDETVSVCYDPSNPEEGPKMLRVIIKSTNPNMKVDVKHKELAWKSDFSLLAIGLDDGCVQLFSAPHLQCVHTLLAHKKSVFFLAWHPQCTATDTDGAKSSQCHWLASSSVDHQIKVFDLTPLVPDDEAGSWKHVGLPIEPFTELKHGSKVVSLCWNPHIGGQLASSSYDKSVRVWDIARNQLLACYKGHSGCVLSCCWSLVDPDVVLSGSADFTVQVWRISKSQPQEEILSSEIQPSVTSDVQQHAEPLSPLVVKTKQRTTKNEEPQTGAGKSAAQKKGKKSHQNKITKLHMFPVSGCASHNKENAMACCETMLQAKGVLPTVQLPEPAMEATPEQAAGDVSASSQPCIDNTTNGTDSAQTQIDEALLVVKNTPNIGYFTSQENFQAMLDLDGKALATSGNYNGLHNLELWRGNLHETLKTAAQTKHLNDWLVSIAPTVSHKVWLEMCTAYAKQLAEEEDFMKAASYLLVCHKVLDAVDLLKSHGCFREAVVLCRCRLGPDDPTTKSTMMEWAKSATHLGTLELAIQCYIACDEYDKAVHLLSKRNDVKMWQLGAILAEKTGNKVMCSSLISECLSACLQEEKWTDATTLITQHPELMHLQLLVETHKIVSELGKEEPPSKEQLAFIWSASTSGDTKDAEGLLDSIGKICSDQEEGLYEKLTTLLPPKISLPDNRKELLMQTSRLLLLAAVARKEKNDDWERFVINALHISHRRNLVCVKERPLHYLLWWLRAPVLEKMLKSEKAFICDAMLDCLSKDNPETPKLLLSNKEFLLDTDSALYSRLNIVAKNLEKEVATAQAAGNESAEQVRESLAETRNSLKELENDRVAFPNTLVMICKLKNYIDYFRQKDMLSREELELWNEDLTAFHKNFHK